jgi:hypothetical protein
MIIGTIEYSLHPRILLEIMGTKSGEVGFELR